MNENASGSFQGNVDPTSSWSRERATEDMIADFPWRTVLLAFIHLGLRILILWGGWVVCSHGLWGRILGIICFSLILLEPQLLKIFGSGSCTDEPPHGSLATEELPIIEEEDLSLESQAWWRRPVILGPLTSLVCGFALGFLLAALFAAYLALSFFELISGGLIVGLLGAGGGATLWVESDSRRARSFTDTMYLILVAAFIVLLSFGFWHKVVAEFGLAAVFVLLGCTFLLLSVVIGFFWALSVAISSRCGWADVP